MNNVNNDLIHKKPVLVDVVPGQKIAWCSCGYSADQIHCDGSHRAHGMRPVVQEFTEAKKVALCGCKLTGNAPFCDGSHSKLS